MTKKRISRFISSCLMAALILTAVPITSADAALSEVKSPSQVTTFKSSTTFDKEYVRAYVTDEHTLKVIYKTPLESTKFRISLYRVGENKGDIDLDIYTDASISYASDGTKLYGFTYYIDMERFDVPSGYYNLYIKRCATQATADALDFDESGILYKNMEIKVSSKKVKILRYTDVINYNNSIKKIGAIYSTDKYLDNTLEDIRFVLRNPATQVYATMTSSKISYIKRISDRVVSGATTDYEKLQKIYEYTAKNFYYDTIAFTTHSYQYADPYENIYNFENGLSSSNSSAGRVYTTCQGFSAIYLALARAQGIPTRFVYGHRLAIPSNDWLTEDNIDVRDHWWCESYVNGRWIFVDPTVGTTNKYNKNTGVWNYKGLTNYTYFDPSDEQIATSHVYMNIYPDYRAGKYMDDETELSTLRAFLNQTGDTSSYSYSYNTRGTNGYKLDSSYNAYDTSTWGDGTKSHFMTNGKGKLSQIQWSNKKLAGALNLSGFSKLVLLSSHGNEYTSADLSDNPSLKQVYIQNNNLETVDLTNCYKLNYVRAQYNPMKSFSLYVNGANRTFTASDNGTMYFTLDTRYTNMSLSLYSKPAVGYKLAGVYSTSTGNLLSTKTAYHFTPKASGYSIKFTLDPDSYKYYLTEGESRSSRVKYIQAAAKRLNELGYYSTGYSSTEVGSEKSFTSELKEATIKFQVMNDINNTGNIGSQTWSALFSNSAVSMVSDYEYEKALANYEAMKVQRAEATEAMSTLTVKASSAASKGKMNISWEVSSDTADVSSIGITGYEVYKSKSKASGYSLISDTANMEITNTSSLEKGTRYYYKVRAYAEIGGKKIYSEYSNVTYKKAK